MDTIKKASIMGTEYTVIFTDILDDPRLDGNQAICNSFNQEIVVSLKCRSDNGRELDRYPRQINDSTRHEIVHALIYESGLRSNPFCGRIEEICVAWLAAVFPRIHKAVITADLVEDVFQIKTLPIFEIDYKVILTTEAEYPQYLQNTYSASRFVEKEMYVDTANKRGEPFSPERVRHYIVHGIICSFKNESSYSEGLPTGIEEAFTEWTACQYPRLQKIFQDLDVLT